MSPWLFTTVRGRTSRALWQTLVACWALTFVAPALYTWLDPDSLRRPLGIHDNALFAWYLKFFPLHRIPEFIAGLTFAVIWERRYATYILHVPLYVVVARFEGSMWKNPSPGGVALYLAITLTTSLAAYRFVEEPCRRFIVRRLSKHQHEYPERPSTPGVS